jgi:hypothetical protein
MAESVQEELNALVARVGKVRRWLMALAVLKVTALCLIFVSVYVGIYAWLDHRVNFEEAGRIIAFVLLVGGLGFLLYMLTRMLLGQISYSGAANYIESKADFGQQLVTAIEYYEKRRDYPYSRALAEHLVLQIDKVSKTFRFDSTVEKWRAHVFAAIILTGLSASYFYVHDNYVYFSSYFVRLTRPLAAVDPVTATSLESLTKDVVVEPKTEVTFAAEIEGRVPEYGKLVIADANSETAEGGEYLRTEEIELQPSLDAEGRPRLEATKSFSGTGQFKYRFETPSTCTDWHKLSVCEAPDVNSMSAEVSLPRRWPRRTWIEPYTEQIKGNTLEVIPYSKVTLNVQSTENLKEAAVTGLDGKPVTQQLNGANQFSFSFTADKSGTIKFDLVGEKGLLGDGVPDLEVIVKTDEPPKFELVSPDGDYLATDVASVPITFKVTDDFGLDSVKMSLEMPGQQPDEMAVPVEKGSKSETFTHTLELEEYDLAVGDSILFYAEATDIDTGSALAHRTSSSDVYFIEIRPYQQYWSPGCGGGGGYGGGGAAMAKLLDILEYTRAILKKTWVISSKPELAEQDRSSLESIKGDVQYCDAQLERIRDDSEYGFSELDKAVLNEVLGHYEQASQYLAEHNASSAMMPIKDAYRVLRKFINELEMKLKPPSPSSASQQPEKPDSVKLEDKPEFGEYEKERIEAEVKKFQQKLEKAAQEQKELKKTFEKFLEQQAEQKKLAQEAADEQPSMGADGKSAQGKDGSKSEGKNQSADQSQSGSKGQNGAKGKGTGKGKSPSDSSSAKAGQNGSPAESSADGQKTGSKGEGPAKGGKPSGDSSAKAGQNGSPGKSGAEGQSGPKGQSTGKGEGLGRPGIASDEKRLKMLQAKQKALGQEVSQLKEDLKQLPKVSEGGEGQGRGEAQKHLDEAVAKMGDFDSELTEARYGGDIGKGRAREAVELLDSAKRELDLARKALDAELTLNDEQLAAQQAREMAEQLAEDADALDESVTPLEREQMLARLEAAKRLLESMAQPEWGTISKKSPGSSSAGHVYTRNPNIASARVARAMARQFWSIAINAKRQKARLIEDERSDVKFYEMETEFFENAARFDKKAAQK